MTYKIDHGPRTILARRMRKHETKIDIIIIHAMSEYVVSDGNIIHCMDFLNDIDLGAHYFIAPDGLITNGVPPEYRTPHVGRSQYNGRKWLNETSIGIEFLLPGVNTYGEFRQALNEPEPFSSEQYLAGAELVAKLQIKFPATEGNVIGHDDVAGDDVRGEGRGKKDPGSNFNWGTFLALVKDISWQKLSVKNESLEKDS